MTRLIHVTRARRILAPTAVALTGLLLFPGSFASGPLPGYASARAQKNRWKLLRTVNLPTDRRAPDTKKKGLLLDRWVEYLGNETVAVVSTWRFDDGPFRTLEAVLVASQSGKTWRSMTLTSSMQSGFGYGLFPVHDGGFIFWLGDKLIRYSQQGEALRELDLPGWRFTKWNTLASWHVRDAPGGRILRLSYGSVDERQTKCIWRDVDTFEETFSSSASDCPLIRVGEEIVPTRSESQAGFEVLNKEGEVLFEGERYGGKYGGLVAKFSLSRNRFVILDAKSAIPLIQKRSYFDWRFYAKVFDMACQCKVAEISLGTQTATVTDVALSPDGTELAVVTDDELRLFRLP